MSNWFKQNVYLQKSEKHFVLACKKWSQTKILSQKFIWDAFLAAKQQQRHKNGRIEAFCSLYYTCINEKQNENMKTSSIVARFTDFGRNQMTMFVEHPNVIETFAFCWHWKQILRNQCDVDLCFAWMWTWSVYIDVIVSWPLSLNIVTLRFDCDFTLFFKMKMCAFDLQTFFKSLNSMDFKTLKTTLKFTLFEKVHRKLKFFYSFFLKQKTEFLKVAELVRVSSNFHWIWKLLTCCAAYFRFFSRSLPLSSYMRFNSLFYCSTRFTCFYRANRRFFFSYFASPYRIGFFFSLQEVDCT